MAIKLFFQKKICPSQSLTRFFAEEIIFQDFPVTDRSAYLYQLAEIGLVSHEDSGYVLKWQDLYELTDNPEHADSINLLGLPPWCDARPSLSSNGALTDPDFRINLNGWNNPNGTPFSGSGWVQGGLIDIDGQKMLLRQPAWALAVAVIRFASLPSSEHTTEVNYQHWGRIRRLALAAEANLDDFLAKTIVLTPDTLSLELERLNHSASLDESGSTLSAIRVTPSFQDAPAEWLARFDALGTIPDYYNLPQAGGGLIHVAISEPVKQVLREIKRMPGRVARTPRAQAFIRNPYAVLGEAAETVITPECHEASLNSSNIVFYTFELATERDGKGNILSIFLDLEATRSGAIPAFHRHTFKTPDALSQLIAEMQCQLEEGYPSFHWQGHEVELRSDAEDKLEQLRAWHERWQHPVPGITYEEVYEFPDYARRVIEIGELKPYYSPFIFKTEPQAPWLDVSTLIGIGASPDRPRLLIHTQTELDQFANATVQAKADGKEAFDYPGLDKPIRLAEAEALIPMAQGVINATREGKPPPPSVVKKIENSRKGLLIITNVGPNEYAEPCPMRDEPEMRAAIPA